MTTHPNGQPSPRRRLIRRVGALLLMSLTAMLMPIIGVTAESEPPPERVRLPLPEARRLVSLMDDIYRHGVLTTHSMYVQGPGVASAVTWGKQVMKQVEARGWPEARVFDATGRPLNPENKPLNGFERDAVQAMLKGRVSLEKVEPKVLRYATAIRAVDKSCLSCHVRSKQDDLLGGLSYQVLLSPTKSKIER